MAATDLDLEGSRIDDIYLTPTLVIGVGGTGSEIAGRLYREGQRKGLGRRKLLAVLALDTDDIDHRRLQVNEANKVRFSTTATIAELMRRNPELRNEWLYQPEELSAEIRNMTLVNGAGQVRMFTRLALHDALRHGTLETSIRSSMLQLAEVSNQLAYEGRINVLILGSLAGGTGCGSFLQIPLICRQIARGTSVQKLDVRGMFLLPDVYIYGTGMAHDHISNVAANAVAAMRELNAVTQVASEHLPLETVSFEYMPKINLQRGQIPYDLVTLIDYEMIGGGNLGKNIEHYKDLMERAARTSLFLPLGQKFEQRTVNSVQDKLSAIDINSIKNFASVGVFAITYPEEEVLDHLTNRFANEILDGDWLALDRSFRRRMVVYEGRRRAGDVSVQAPDRGESFITDLEQYASDRRPLFTEIQANVFEETVNDEGRTERRVHFENFLAAFDSYVRAQFRNSTEGVRNLWNASRVQPSQFESREDLPDIVQRREAALNQHWRAVSDAVRQVPDGLYDNYWLGALTMDASEWQTHHLQRYVVAQAPHLLQVRYFLYLTKRAIAKRLKELDSAKVAVDVVEASAPFEDDRRPAKGMRAGQGPVNRAADVAEQGLLKRAFGSERQKFVAAYVRYHDTSLDNMRLYGETAAARRAMERLENDIDLLLRLLELLFADLETLQGELKARIEEDRGLHAIVSGAVQGNRYVYAGPLAKDAIWDEIKPNVQGQKIGREANSRLVAALFSEVRARRERSAAQTRPGERGSFSLRNLFNEVVVQGFCHSTLTESFGATYSFNVAEAMRREAALSGQDFEGFATELVRVTSTQAKPFIMLDNDEPGSELVYWAMHPRTKEALVRAELFDRLFRYENTVSAVDGREYDPRQLLCVDIRYNFPIVSILKLKPGDRDSRSSYDAPPGRYDKYYREVIEKVIESDARQPGRPRSKLTPHVDKEWHKPAGLPEIHLEIERDRVDTLYEDFAIAVGMKYLRKEDDAGDPAMVFYDPTRLEQGSRAVVTLGQAMDRLLGEFKRRPEIAVASRAGFGKALDDARLQIDRGIKFDTLPVFTNMFSAEPLMSLLEVARNRTASTDGEVARIVQGHLGVLNTVYGRLRPELEPNRKEQMFANISHTLFEEALEGLKGRLSQDTFNRTETLVRNGLEGFMPDWSN